MVEVKKAEEIDRIVASPPASVGFFLVYGPDAGLVAERARAIAMAKADAADPFSRIVLDAAALAADPSRLADEAYAVSMFGGRRSILVRDAGSRPSLVDAIGALMRSPPPETTVVAEGGDLKKSHALRALFERSKTAYALPCYEDDDAAIGRLVAAEAAAHGLAVSPEARAFLVDRLGGDRLVSRGEIRKLCLYALGTGRIELADADLLVGDSAGIAAEEVADACAVGDLSGLLSALGRARAAGLGTEELARTAFRHFQTLDAARPGVEAGRSPAEVVEGLRPPVFFRRKAAVTTALGLWTAARLQRATSLLADTVRDTRLNAALAPEILEATLLTLARVAAQARSRR